MPSLTNLVSLLLAQRLPACWLSRRRSPNCSQSGYSRTTKCWTNRRIRSAQKTGLIRTESTKRLRLPVLTVLLRHLHKIPRSRYRQQRLQPGSVIADCLSSGAALSGTKAVGWCTCWGGSRAIVGCQGWWPIELTFT